MIQIGRLSSQPCGIRGATRPPRRFGNSCLIRQGFKSAATSGPPPFALLRPSTQRRLCALASLLSVMTRPSKNAPSTAYPPLPTAVQCRPRRTLSAWLTSVAWSRARTGQRKRPKNFAFQQAPLNAQSRASHFGKAGGPRMTRAALNSNSRRATRRSSGEPLVPREGKAPRNIVDGNKRGRSRIGNSQAARKSSPSTC